MAAAAARGRRFNGLLCAVRRGGVVVSGRPRGYGTVLGGPNGNAVATATSTKSTVIETTVERVIFDFRFLALLAVAGSLAGSLRLLHKRRCKGANRGGAE